MIEDIINLKYYSGRDTYSDGNIEDDILKSLQENDDILDVLMNHSEWPYLYHLSPMRENLLEWYEFNKDGTLLEIGSGCGALTGLFCKKLKRVVGIDLSKKRSMINAIKNKNYSNFEIMVGNFEDVKLKEKFDYVTLIGVLEYSIYYINGDNPFRVMLEKARAYLKQGGALIVAIENKYGLKYWSGVKEDHTGNMYDGIENYWEESRVRTFSRGMLKELFSEAGFNKTCFYYPVPDYKIPEVIYSDEYLPKVGDIRNSTVSYDRNQYNLFDQDKAFDAVCSDNLFSEFSNSFLVIARED